MKLQKVIVIGAGGHARSCLDVIEQVGGYEICGLVGLASDVHSEKFGYSVIGTDSDLESLRVVHNCALIGVGQIESADIRIRIHRKLEMLGFELPVFISPIAYVSPHAKIGAGTIVQHGAIVNSGATIGENCIINSGALIEHDVKVGNHCHISTSVTLNGDVCVGDETFVGSGSVVREGVTIGGGCLIGMKLSVRKNLSDNSRFTGSH